MDNPTGPLSRRVTHEDRQGIETLFNAAADAWRKEDVQALMTLYDLSIYAGTDNAAGALEGRNGFTVIICITESLVPIHAPASDSAATPKNRRRSCRGCATYVSALA